MSKAQAKALRLAECLEGKSRGVPWTREEAAAELRRLHAELERKSTAIQKLWKERDAMKAERDELLEALRETEYALDYAADMTKPEGLSGCDCPICSVSVKVRAAIAKFKGETL